MRLKNIYLIHHSHLDIGFTHSQVVVEQLQTDFINQALDLLDATKDWDELSRPRWTIEVSQQLKLWLASATAKDLARLKRHVRGKRLGLGAIQYNTTPLSSIESLCRQLAEVRYYRKKFGFPVRAAFQHDINGLPWVMSDLLLDAGVELFVMAINLHTGGNGPVRPGMFRWRTPSGRALRVFSGNHYSAFDEITHPYRSSVPEMKTAVDAYWEMLQDLGYPYDFLYLSATNLPVAYDNGGPSHTTAGKVREWNRQKSYPRIQYITPELLLEKLKRIPDRKLPEFSGDWNDFWNYGAGSTARETAMNAETKQKLFKSALIGTRLPQSPRLESLQDTAWDKVTLYDEHTWGAWASAARPEYPFTIVTEGWKRCLAYDGQEYARYTLASRLADYAGNPPMYEPGGLLAINPSPVRQAITFDVQRGWDEGLRGHLQGFTGPGSDPEAIEGEDTFTHGMPTGKRVFLEMDPFSAIRVPWADCREPEAGKGLHEGSSEEVLSVQVLDGHERELRKKGLRFIESPFHRMEYDPSNGRIMRLFDRKTGWEVLPQGAEYNLLEPIHEKPDPRFDASRKSYYDRIVATEVRFQDCWNSDWRGARSGVRSFAGVRIERHERAISLVREYSLEGAPRIIQRFELSVDRPWIEADILLHKDRVESPESIYFVTQLNLGKGWEALYDGSGIPVKLDEENLDRSSKGWITAESFVRMEDRRNQFSVFAPGMPLVQIGDFNWGKPRERIPRPARPLMVNWACNNYWETNFPVTQEGIIRYRMGIHTSRGHAPADTYRQADGFARRPLFLPLASCAKMESAPLVFLSNTRVRLASVERARYGKGWVYRLVNPGSRRETATLDLERRVSAASLVTPLEETSGVCQFKGSVIKVSVPSRRVVSVLVRF